MVESWFVGTKDQEEGAATLVQVTDWVVVWAFECFPHYVRDRELEPSRWRLEGGFSDAHTEMAFSPMGVSLYTP